MNQETQETISPLAKQSSELLSLLVDFSEKKGYGHLWFCLRHLSTDTIYVPSESSKSLNEIIYYLDNCLNNYSVEFMMMFLNLYKWNGTSVMKKNTVKQNANQIINTTCRVFKITRKKLEKLNTRDGNRIYASGSIIVLLGDLLNLRQDEIGNVIQKKKAIISKHRSYVKNLDYQHPYEKKILRKYLNCKKLIINTYLNGQQEA